MTERRPSNSRTRASSYPDRSLLYPGKKDDSHKVYSIRKEAGCRDCLAWTETLSKSATNSPNKQKGNEMPELGILTIDDCRPSETRRGGTEVIPTDLNAAATFWGRFFALEVPVNSSFFLLPSLAGRTMPSISSSRSSSGELLRLSNDGLREWLRRLYLDSERSRDGGEPSLLRGCVVFDGE